MDDLEGQTGRPAAAQGGGSGRHAPLLQSASGSVIPATTAPLPDLLSGGGGEWDQHPKNHSPSHRAAAANTSTDAYYLAWNDGGGAFHPPHYRPPAPRADRYEEPCAAPGTGYDNAVMVDGDERPPPPPSHAEAAAAAATAAAEEESILTEDGIHDLIGFYCVCLVMLIGDMSRGVMFPSMWPLVQALGGSEVTLGYAVASFSFGRALVNPAFGYMSNVRGYTSTLLLSTSILLLGTLLYAQVQNLGSPHALIVAQTVLGIGSGTLGVTRAFVADVTAKRHRTRYMGLITAVQYGGFTVTPVFGALFNHWLEDVDWRVGPFRWNMFTAPAYFMGFVVATTLVALLVFFRGRKKIVTAKDAAPPPKTARRLEVDALANAASWVSCITVYDCCILGCMLLNVSTKGSIASFETLGIAIAQRFFDMESSVAGGVVAACGAIGVASLLSMGHLEQRLTDVQLISGGMVVMVVGIASLSTIEHRDPDQNPPFLYGFAMFLIYSIGYPIGHTAVIGLFSKIVGRRPQGTLLGWFASAGSFARMLFPIASGYIARYRDVETLFLALICVLMASTAIVLAFRRTLNLLAS